VWSSVASWALCRASRYAVRLWMRDASRNYIRHIRRVTDAPTQDRTNMTRDRSSMTQTQDRIYMTQDIHVTDTRQDIYDTDAG